MVLLQVHVQVQAFLTLPDLTADGGGLDDRCQVIQPFSVETAVDHCVEPTSSGNYRRAPHPCLLVLCDILHSHQLLWLLQCLLHTTVTQQQVPCQ